nr:MAG TPA: hypothetical protein [Caudoviricetes sp.]
MLKLDITKLEMRLIKKALSAYRKNSTNKEEKEILKDILNLINYQMQ